MAYGLGLTVQVGERGQLYTSEDLVYWEPQYTRTDKALLAVTFFNNRLIAAGENGTVIYADSLADFRLVDLGTSDWLMGAAASGNGVVLVGDNAALYLSSDGATWTRQSPPAGFTGWLRHVTFGKNLFVAVGENGAILTSNNGRLWKRETSGVTQHLNRVAFLNDTFVAAGEQGVLLTSANGSSWQVASSPGVTNTWFALAGVTNELLAAGQGQLRHRRGLAAWTDETSPGKSNAAPAWTYYSAVHDGTLYLVAGRSGMMVEGVAEANQPLRWIHRFPGPRHWLWDLCRAGEIYTAVGDRATILTSSDGVQWSLEAVPPTATNAILLGVAGSSNRLVAVGNQGAVLLSEGYLTNILATNLQGRLVTNTATTLGIFWRELPQRLTTNDLQAVALRGQEIIVAGGNGVLFHSPDGGQTWQQRATPVPHFLSGAAAYPGGWVVVGDRGTLLTSADGIQWSAQPTGRTNWIFRVRWVEDRLAAVGQGGLLLFSTNGLNWTPQATGVTTWLNDVTRVGGIWYVVGNQGTVLASTNGHAWINVGTLTQKSLFGAATQAGQLVVAGVEGALLRAQIVPRTNPPVFVRFTVTAPTNATVRRLFLMAGETDQRILIERSLDLRTWTNGPAVELLDPSGTVLVVDDAPRQAREFFRARLQP
ncbi:MAG: hypothetical protein N3J91_07220 [Verrucomicrobiae bacterium]|nr:hypothetical protein [Verrucomicrobiae bacterium]